jgi:hypothetical protein
MLLMASQHISFPLKTSEKKAWTDLRVAIYMTTHLSEEHVEFLQKCWPAGLAKLPLLQHAHLILYTSGNATDELLKMLPFQSVVVKHYDEEPLTYEQYDKRKQIGAIRAMQDPFKGDNDWFKGYDWVIRLNPDVLIRRDEWLRATMVNETIDAILIRFMAQRIHTDFTAFRPRAINKTRLLHSPFTNAEQHMFGGVEHLVQSGRVAWLPHAQHIPEGIGRVVGSKSAVVHHHDLYRHCPAYFNATKGNFFLIILFLLFLCLVWLLRSFPTRKTNVRVMLT